MTLQLKEKDSICQTLLIICNNLASILTFAIAVSLLLD